MCKHRLTGHLGMATTLALNTPNRNNGKSSEYAMGCDLPPINGAVNIGITPQGAEVTRKQSMLTTEHTLGRVRLNAMLKTTIPLSQYHEPYSPHGRQHQNGQSLCWDANSALQSHEREREKRNKKRKRHKCGGLLRVIWVCVCDNTYH